MKCFYHPQVDATGVCKHCSRGICLECTSERIGGLACKNRHEEIVDRVSNLIDRNMRATSRAGLINVLAAAVFWTSTAVFFYLLLREPSQTMKLMFGVMTAWSLVLAVANTRALLLRKRRGSLEISGQEKPGN